MQTLELLAPARNLDIGIAAIDCGADAVYIAGPDFGARKAAGNEFEDIAKLCDYAHKYGARVFVTFNTVFSEAEAPEVHRQMMAAQDAGADAFIIREPVICSWSDIRVPLHASTQCAIRNVQRAKMWEDLGCSRIVLERQLSLTQVAEIAAAVSCEIEFFVHGALCVCYSGDCKLSEHINGRSADRGDCMQACRSLYDLVDEDGRVLVRNKALLSLKDYNLRSRLAELSDAGVCSFKIEGRLKNISYVRNVVRDYDLALNKLVASNPSQYRRASFGRVEGGFTPDTSKTFNRAYTELFLDAKRDQWSSMDAPKSMGEYVGIVSRLLQGELQIKACRPDIEFHNGDGFAFATAQGVVGFRGDVCKGTNIKSRDLANASAKRDGAGAARIYSGLKVGTKLYRNLDSAFEQMLDSQVCKRYMTIYLSLCVHKDLSISIDASCEDGRHLVLNFTPTSEAASNTERSRTMLIEQLSKRSGHYSLQVSKLSFEDVLPFLSAAAINAIRREIVAQFDTMPCLRIPMAGEGNTLTKSCESLQMKSNNASYGKVNAQTGAQELMRSKYCVRHELGLCPKQKRAKAASTLYILNNGRRFALNFDCKHCEMTVTAA